MTRSLAGLRGFIVDLDGTTYLGSTLIPGADRFLDVLRATERRHIFVTNNSSTIGAAYEQKLRDLGLDVHEGDVVTSGAATCMVLRSRGIRRVYVVGTPALEGEVRQAGLAIESGTPDAVVLGFDRTLTYAKLETATRLIRRGVPFYATHPDKVCPTETGYIPDCGAMIALLEVATGVSPTVVGKPEPLLVQMALEHIGLTASEVAVVGDRLYTDVAMAHRAGTAGILVLSGETRAEALAGASVQPDFVFDDLGALANALAAAGRSTADTLAREVC